MKTSAKILAAAGMTLFVACGDVVENSYRTGMEVVASEDDLPECTSENEGEQAFVTGESSMRVCTDGEWFVTAGSNSVYVSADVSCSTEELEDKSGLKIVCNGDSIGVVLNGAAGKDGANGKDGKDGEKGDDGDRGKDGAAGRDCSISEQTDSSVTIACGDSMMVIELGRVGHSTEEVEPDSEMIATSLDSLVGYTQKGPFLKGSTVYLYELSDGRTLKQTNGNFTSNIERDDGRYKFTARDLVSQYAMVVVDGYFRNELTGAPSDGQIRLKALTDLRRNSSVNVNLLTHLEFERVYYLVTREGYTVKQAKRQAQYEILRLFGIELDEEKDSENMNVFGSSDADAALLAISVLLQGNRPVSELIVLLTEISNAIVENGMWNDQEARVQIAEWALTTDLGKIRENIENWGLASSAVSEKFEKYIENFIAQTFRVNACGENDTGARLFGNTLSRFYGHVYHCWNGKFVIRSDSSYFNRETKYGALIDSRDRRLYRTVTLNDHEWMAENLNYDYKVKPLGRENYETFDNVCANFDPTGYRYGRFYTWAVAMDSATIFSEGGRGCGFEKNCSPTGSIRGICPEGWHLPTMSEYQNMFYSLVGGQTDAGITLKSAYGWNLKNFSTCVTCGDGSGDNRYGFSVRPAGNITTEDDGDYTYFWTATGFGLDYAVSVYFSINNNDAVQRQEFKTRKYSIRCVKDD